MKEKIVILGGGESGVGAAILAGAKGYDVFLSDSGLIASKRKIILREHNIDFEEGQHDTNIIFTASEIIKSPGIPDQIPMLESARAKNIPVISEIEFAMRHSKAKFIGITGTNGKTTTTLLTYHLLKENGYDVGLAGNIGHSLAQQVAEADKEYFVVELSSFQLDGMYKAKLHIAILLNITPDHLNRYNNDFELYAQSKIRIARNMRKEDLLIYNQSDSTVCEQIKHIKSHVDIAPISLEKLDNSAAFASKSSLTFHEKEGDIKIGKKQLPLLGKHNMLNTMAAIKATRKAGLDWEAIIAALKSFENAPHRLEHVVNINGVDFYNDSKATNVDAVWYALESFDNGVILILGGQDKGNDYSQIDELVKEKVKAIVALGLDNTKIETHFKSFVADVSSTDSVFNAVEIANSKASEGDVVLLSPACASFDLFKNYEERGARFKEACHGLKEKVENNKNMMS